jgi:hypothetical protein
MAIITLFWKDQIGLSLTNILLLQGISSIATVVMEYPSGYRIPGCTQFCGTTGDYRLGPLRLRRFLQPGASPAC